MRQGRRLRVIAFGFNAISMTYTICRLFANVRPFDWLMFVIELAVLVVILLFEIRTVRREDREDRERRERKALIHERVAEMRDAMSEGHQLLLSSVQSGDSRTDQWAQAVSKWNSKTCELLRSYSPQAETAFLFREPGNPSKYGSIGAVFEYISLTSGLANLRGIIEKPDVYF